MECYFNQSVDQFDTAAQLKITTCNIIATGFGIIMRLVTIIVNYYFAYDYWRSELYAYSAWTIGSILLPMVVTSLIYYNILTLNDDRSEYCGRTLGKIAYSYLFRDNYTLKWALKCNNAARIGDKRAQIEYYKRNLKEECNVGFIRLFDSFLEAAPQKILQMAIVLKNLKMLTYYRGLVFVLYFVSIAWCLMTYNRSNRLAQSDKYDISAKGQIAQLCFLLCLTVSRTLCIAFMASIYPAHTLLACIAHIILCGTVVFVVDAPNFAKSELFNYLLCLTFGVVYLFIFTPVKDGPTKYKYCIYLVFCLFQNIAACIFFIPLYFSISIIALYLSGIVFMILYYACCHPRIDAVSNNIEGEK